MESKPIVPKTMTIQQCLEVLESRDFSNLIGTIESEVLEFKGDLYQLDSEKEKLELAKDVSALANHSGGIILIGVGTSIPEEHPHEMIDRIRPLDESLISTKQYEDVIGSWIYPNLNTQIKWIPSQAKPQKGIMYILIPETEVEKKPFLITKVLQENDKLLGNVVGFFQRKGDKVVHWSAEELHHVFKDGLRFERFDEHLSEIDEKLSEILSQKRTLEPYGIDPETIEQRIENAIEAVGLAENTSYVLLSYPETTVEITGLFERRTSDVVKLIENPPELRSSGFDLNVHESSKIINGELRRASLKSYGSLEVRQDGTIIFVADGENFLCWGKYRKDNFLRINTIALVESVYLFALFMKEVYEKANLPDCKIQVQLNLKGIPSEKKYVLPKSAPMSKRWYANVNLVEATFSELTVNKRLLWGKTRAEEMAYQIVADFYAKFSVEHEFIPYTKEEHGMKVIDPEQIKALG